jgi:hypothetical protein
MMVWAWAMRAFDLAEAVRTAAVFSHIYLRQLHRRAEPEVAIALHSRLFVSALYCLRISTNGKVLISREESSRHAAGILHDLCGRKTIG